MRICISWHLKYNDKVTWRLALSSFKVFMGICSMYIRKSIYYYSDIFDNIPISKQLDIYGIVSEIWHIFINSRICWYVWRVLRVWNQFLFGCLSPFRVLELWDIFHRNLLTVAVPEIWDILEIQKMKISSEVPNFMGKMNFRSKCA